MKNYIVLALVMLVASPVFSQKKEKDAAAPVVAPPVATDTLPVAAPVPVVTPPAVEGDSLTKANQALKGKLDSISVKLEAYRGLYTAIKEKVLKSDFDPARISVIIDSLAARRDSTFTALGAFVTLKDSLILLKQEHAQLKARYDSYRTEEVAKARLVAELKQLKELLDAKVLTQTEFDIKKAMVLRRWE